MHETHPRRKLVEETHNIRLKRTSTWRENAKTAMHDIINQDEREEFAKCTIAPWIRPKVNIRTYIYQGNTKKQLIEDK